MSDTININATHYAVRFFRGKVLPNHDAAAQAERGKLYLQDGAGEQNITEQADARVLEWVGHDVVKIWLTRDDDENGLVVGFFNATLDKFHWLYDAWQDFRCYPVWLKLVELLVILMAFGAVFYMKLMVDNWVFAVLFSGLFVALSAYNKWLVQRYARRVKAWQETIMAMLNQRYG